MKFYCELFTKNFLPAIRAIIAENLIEKYGLTQIEVAKKMGLTQAAVSHYLRSKRGAKAYNLLRQNSDVLNYIEKLAELIYRGKGATKEAYKYVCKICGWIRQRKDIVDEVVNVHEEIMFPIANEE